MQYIIVQAGGRGRRMELLTRNKPKALVPVQNLPMLFHLFRKFPQKKFIIIGDYKFDVLQRYLKAFGAAEVDYELVRATGHHGTCAGLQTALGHIPDGESFLLIWCDLILTLNISLPDCKKNIIGLSTEFSCRWSYQDGHFTEKPSIMHGVAGFFIFQNKSYLVDVPENGEFVRWLQKKNIVFQEFPLIGAKEYGLYQEWLKLPRMRCRPFNELTVKGDRLTKCGINEQGRQLGIREAAWYKAMQGLNFSNIPHIYSVNPLTMELIDGKNIYEYNFIPKAQKKDILCQIITCLKQVHQLGCVSADRDSYYEAYIGKTFQRLEKVRQLVPFANDQYITVNGRKCHNIFYCREKTESAVMKYMPKKFYLIHGDCTFSNTMLRHDSDPVLIDPRGYFGHMELYGDVAYDWVKLYYSIVSNYDQFNLKRFTLDIDDHSVHLDIASSNWEDMETEFFRLLDGEVTQQQMKLLLAITWLSLTTYAWEDYDSICGAFYYGLYWLEDAFRMESAYNYFQKNMLIMEDSLKSISRASFEALLDDCERTLTNPAQKIIVSGLGKNVPIGEKFVGTMLSLGLNANFLHTDSALHGDLGMVRHGDLVILLTKSGATEESEALARALQKRSGVILWLVTFCVESELSSFIPKRLVLQLSDEGDLWNIVPNNSTTLNLIVLQTLAIELARRMGLDLKHDFQPNHPGGAIGARLRYER